MNITTKNYMKFIFYSFFLAKILPTDRTFHKLGYTHVNTLLMEKK